MEQTLDNMGDITVDQLNSWFEVLHRVSQLQFDDPFAVVNVPQPLRKDIQECVDRGWLMAWQSEGTQSGGMLRLMIRPDGRVVYRQMCEQLEAEGRPVNPCWINSFD